MDRSYRLKMEERLRNKILTIDYVVNCIAKNENKINDLAYKDKRYCNMGFNNYKPQLDQLIFYRQPFVDLLTGVCHIPLQKIKQLVVGVKEDNIPSKKVCDQIRNIIVSGTYWIE